MIKNITIGSDPEFIFEDKKGFMVSSYDIIRPRRMSVCGERDPDCDSCHKSSIFCSHGSSNAQIGTDGSLGELRPKPGRTPLEHVNNIQELINAFTFLPEGMVVKGGTIQHRAAIGGHIHIGMPIADHLHCAQWMSHYCGIPLRKIERYEDLKLRGLSASSFGRFAGYDTKSYGIEWRMPASWLVSKEIATAALCLAYVVAQNYDTNYVPMKRPQYLQMIKSDISPTIEFIENMEGYEVYRREIAPLIHMIEQEQIWNINNNVLDTWK